MTVGKTLRYQVLRRDNHTCRYCGRSAPEVKLTIDHVIAEALGGPDTPENLVTACEACNSGKSATPPDAAIVADVEASAIRWAAAMEAVREKRRADRSQRDETRASFLHAWTTHAAGQPQRRNLDLPDGWPRTVDQLSSAGLETGDLLDAIDISMRTEKVTEVFKYCCGVAWRMVRQLQEAARAAMSQSAGNEQQLRHPPITIDCPHCSGDIALDLDLGDLTPIVVGAPPIPTMSRP